MAMELDVRIQLLKFCWAVLSGIFLALGVSLSGCAVWVLFDNGSFISVISSGVLAQVGAGLLLIGVVVVVVGLLGCLGAQTGNRALLVLYVGLLLLLLLGQVFVTFLLLINKEKIGERLDEAVNDMLLSFGGRDKRNDTLMDQLQRYGGCCGVTDASDWLKNSFIQMHNLTSPDLLPCSCFSFSHPPVTWCSQLPHLATPPFGLATNISAKGCRETLTDWLDENIVTIAGMDLSLILMQVLQSVLAISLIRCFGQKAALKRSHPLVAGGSAPLDHVFAHDGGEQNPADTHPAEFGSAPTDGAFADDSGEQSLAYMHAADFGSAPLHGGELNLAYVHPADFGSAPLDHGAHNLAYTHPADFGSALLDDGAGGGEQNLSYVHPADFYHGVRYGPQQQW